MLAIKLNKKETKILIQSILLHFPVFGSCHCNPRFALDRRIALCEEENSEKRGKKRIKRGQKPAWYDPARSNMYSEKYYKKHEKRFKKSKILV